MSFGDLEERPAKKRRFFVDDSPVVDRTLSEEPSATDEANAFPEAPSAPSTAPQQRGVGDVTSEAFDGDLLENFLGEHLPYSTVQRLKELSGDDIERGM